MSTNSNNSATAAVLRAIASINGDRSVKPIARLDDIRQRSGSRHVIAAVVWLRGAGYIEYIDGPRGCDGYVITPAGREALRIDEAVQP